MIGLLRKKEHLREAFSQRAKFWAQGKIK